MTNDYLRCSKDFEYCRDWYLEKNKGTWNQTIVKESTPSWVVKDMVDLLPEDSFTLDAKFIDIFSKSGIFLEVIRNKLMRNQAHIDKFPDPKERFNYITRNQLYALVWCDGVEDVVENQLALTTVAIYGRLVDNTNVYRVEIDRKTLKKEEGVHKFIELFYSEEYFKGMKFDVVIGNPPYNNDIYLKFVEVGHKLSTKHSVWITPAKWQAKGGKENDAFREKIVPHMSKIVYYPVSTDIFNIGESAGISYYIADKNVHTNKDLKIICNGQKNFNTDDRYVSSDVKALVNPKIRSIIDKCSTMNNVLGNKLNLHQSYYVKNTDSGHGMTHCSDIEVWGGKAGGEKDMTGKQFFLLGYKSKDELLRLDGVDKYKACLSCMPTGNNKYGAFDESGMAYGLKEILMLKPNQVPKGSYFPLMCFDTENEVRSFISYFNTRFIRFLIVCSIVGTTISSELFRLVPDPGSFDHIFTDKELYDKYGLEQDEINLIESVIKERK